MSPINAYAELLNFIAKGTSQEEVAAFQLSETTQQRARELVQREKQGELTPAEASELDYFVRLEHILRMAKAGARRRIERNCLTKEKHHLI